MLLGWVFTLVAVPFIAAHFVPQQLDRVGGNRVYPETDWDPLLEEFQELEREIRQRDCEHERGLAIIDVTSSYGVPEAEVCCKCGKTFPGLTHVETWVRPLAPPNIKLSW